MLHTGVHLPCSLPDFSPPPSFKTELKYSPYFCAYNKTGEVMQRREKLSLNEIFVFFPFYCSLLLSNFLPMTVRIICICSFQHFNHLKLWIHACQICRWFSLYPFLFSPTLCLSRDLNCKGHKEPKFKA